MQKCSDYRGLKKHITSIRRWQAGVDPLPPSTIDEIHAVAEAGSKPARSRWSIDDRFCQKPLSRLSMPASIRSRPNSHLQPLPLYAILLKLPPIHTEFFAYLDEQLAKIDRFYSEREKEARSRSKALESQLRELEDHRKIFFVSWLTLFPQSILMQFLYRELAQTTTPTALKF